MSNVPKSKRKLSDLEFYSNALKLRRLMTSWLLRDFGIKPTRRNPENFVKRYRFTKEDAERFAEVLDRYGLGQSIYEHFEEWWINARRLQIDKGTQDILHYIRKANAIYPTCEQEYYERRLLQDRAIGACEVLLDDLVFVAETVSSFGVRLNQYQQIVDVLTYLQAVLGGIISISESLGLFVNPKKTFIRPLNKGFVFMQVKYDFTDTGRISKRVVAKKVRRERKKLRAYRRLLTDRKLSRLEISNAYQSWRGNCKQFNARMTVRAMDKFYDSLFVQQ